MRPQHHQHALLVLALALMGCRSDSSGALPSEPRPSLLASRHAAGDPPRFSDWSTAVHLDAPINSPCQDQTPTLSRDQLALYFISKDRKSTRLNSSHRTISYAVFCLKKKKSS